MRSFYAILKCDNRPVFILTQQVKVTEKQSYYLTLITPDLTSEKQKTKKQKHDWLVDYT